MAIQSQEKPIIPSPSVMLYLLDSTSSFQIPSQNIYRRFIHIASKTSIFLNISTSTNGNYALSQVCQTMLCQKFFDLRKRRRELYVQIRTYKSADRTSLFCLHGKLQGKSVEGWVLAESHCIPAACGTAFLKGLSVSIEIFFLLSSHWHTFALWLILAILCKNK